MSELQTTAEQRKELRALRIEDNMTTYCVAAAKALPALLADAELAAALEAAACDLLHFADSFIGADYTMSTDELRERLVRLRAAVATKGDHDD